MSVALAEPPVTSRGLATYDELRRAIAGERLPCAVVSLPAFDRNLERCLAVVRGTGKTLRLATKSIRVPALIERALARSGGLCRGLMCYSVSEAAWLASRGQDDLLVAYPSVQPVDLDLLCEATRRGARLRIVVDSVEHTTALASAARRHGVACEAVLELDVSWRPLPFVHLGARRSPVRGFEQALALVKAAAGEGVRITGLMAYESHVAGLQDRSPTTPLENPLKQALRRLAAPRVASARADVVARLRAAGVELDLVNGGGTGSLATCAREPALTEVTAGSALLAPHLMSAYSDGLPLEPAALFACQVVRAPGPGLVTCHGGGHVASGQAGRDKEPRPHLPPGLELTRLEGAGEVQTPLRTRGCEVALRPGDPVFFRHAKAGELAEHFGEYLLVDGSRIVGRAPTYRGLGERFL